MVSGADTRGLGDLGDLSIQVLRIGHRAVLAASGEIDIATAGQIGPAVTDAIEAGAMDVWLDLSEVTFLDSSGMHSILAARRSAQDRGARFVVICPEGPARRVLRIAGADRGLSIYRDRATAHAAT